jgi:transketolase
MSVRKTFVKLLHAEMKKNKDIVFIIGDLGYGHFDAIRQEFPDRVFNPGAAEQLLLGMACGLAMEGKIPVCYSMTPFLLYRPFEVIRTFIDHEKIPVILAAAGRDKDYGAAGFSHWATDDKEHLSGFKNILKLWPDEKQLENEFQNIIYTEVPYYVNLKR